MNPKVRLLVVVASYAGLAGSTPAFGQAANKPASTEAPPAARSESGKSAVDPYALGTCPVSDKALGSMGDPVVKVYDGREVRFCCGACPETFEKDKAGNLAKLDEKIIKDQAPLYPLKTSLVTGKDLPAKPFQFVYGSRLIQLGTQSEKADFLKDAIKHLATLDSAVIAQQGKDYPLTKCVVTDEPLGGMGEPVNVVVGGRLIKLCCASCKRKVMSEPAKFIAMVDEARKNQAKPGDKPTDSKRGS